METKSTLHVLVIREGEQLVAQCIEYDIAAQAPTLGELQARFDLAIVATVALAIEHGEDPFANVGPAPAWYVEEFKRAVRLGGERRVEIPQEILSRKQIARPVVEFAMAAA